MADASKLCEGLATMSEGMVGQGSIKQEKHGSETWCVMSQSFNSLDEMRTNLNTQGLSINTLSMENGLFIFDATMNIGEDSDEINVGMSFAFTFELTLPGKAIRHNADKVDSYTLVWETGVGQVKQMHAESSLEGRSTDWLTLIQKPIVVLPCIGVIILVLVILIIGELGRGTRQRKPPDLPPVV
jgi:LppM domain